MLPFFWTLELFGASGGEAAFPRALFADLVGEVKRNEYVEVTLVERWTRLVQGASPFEDFAARLEKRSLPYRLRLAGFVPGEEGAALGERFARLPHLQEVEVDLEVPPPGEEPPPPMGEWLGWGVPVSATLPLSADRLEDLEEVVDRLALAGMRTVRFDRLSPPRTGAMDPEDLRQLAGRLATLYQEGRPVAVRGCFPFCHTPALFHNCGGGLHAVTVRPDGHVLPCPHGSASFGNLRGAPLRYLWNSAAASAWQDGRAAACDGCPVFSACRSGCRAMLAPKEAPNSIPDPLIVGFKRRHMPAPIDTPLTLDETLQAHLQARRCHYKYGDFLVHAGRVAAVAPRWSRLLDGLERRPLSLREIRLTQGAEAVELLFSLYLDGAVRLRPPVPEVSS